MFLGPSIISTDSQISIRPPGVVMSPMDVPMGISMGVPMGVPIGVPVGVQIGTPMTIPSDGSRIADPNWFTNGNLIRSGEYVGSPTVMIQTPEGILVSTSGYIDIFVKENKYYIG